MATMTSKLTFSKSDVEGEDVAVVRVIFHGWRIGDVTPRIITDLRSAMSVSYDLENGKSPTMAVRKLAEDACQEYQAILHSLADVLEGMVFSEMETIEEKSLELYFDTRFV